MNKQHGSQVRRTGEVESSSSGTWTSTYFLTCQSGPSSCLHSTGAPSPEAFQLEQGILSPVGIWGSSCQARGNRLEEFQGLSASWSDFQSSGLSPWAAAAEPLQVLLGESACWVHYPFVSVKYMLRFLFHCWLLFTWWIYTVLNVFLSS